MNRYRLLWALLVVIESMFLWKCHAPGPSKPVARSEILFSEIPSDSVLLFGLQPGIPALKKVYALRAEGQWELALESLAGYFKQTATWRYYFSWQDFNSKYADYAERYPAELRRHAKDASRMKSQYAADTEWKLPFNDLQGNPVTAYRLRHLARQSQSLDMVMAYFGDPPQADNLDYWLEQMADLNRAFSDNAYEQGGNDVYEVFRAGKRTHQWLLAHHCYLSQSEYDWQDQIETLRTLLHTAAQLAEEGKNPRPGNHHTRGMVALFEIAASFPEYAQADAWLDQSIQGVIWHLEREINPDGFQFERTVHYHKGDIENYLRVWQLAKRGNIELPDLYETQFRKMFDALLILAQPDKRLPVLQDDTDEPLGETNALSDVMSLGALLWQDPGYAFFANGDVSPLFFWLLNEQDLLRLESTQERTPVLGSVQLPETGYVVFRNGWEINSEYLVISAGLCASKPDHQHADMLGLVAYANGNEILPNYQVKYDRPDYAFWKNSWVKNVALVDSLPQALQWKGNSGGSGFGKWLDLPHPRVEVVWFGEDIDYFCGSHDGFDKMGLQYQREVIFVRAGFWVVCDQFNNPTQAQHEYQQVWQGLFDPLDSRSVERRFENGNRLVIQSLDPDLPTAWRHGRFSVKGNVLRIARSTEKVQRLTTLLAPSLDQTGLLPSGWTLVQDTAQQTNWNGISLGGAEWMIHSDGSLMTRVYALALGDTALRFSQPTHVFIKTNAEGCRVRILSPGRIGYSRLLNDRIVEENIPIESGDIITL